MNSAADSKTQLS